MIFTAKVSKAALVYSNNFENGLGEVENATHKNSQKYNGYGFGKYYAWSSNDENKAITLSLNNLPAHTSLKINFDLAVIDSWDGGEYENNGIWDPDYFNVKVDNSLVFNETFSNFNKEDQSYKDDPIVWKKYLANSSWPDSAYHISLTVPHSSNSVTIKWFASGSGWQGGNDESYAIDNLQVSAVPLPSTVLFLGVGLLGVIGIKRKRN